MITVVKIKTRHFDSFDYWPLVSRSQTVTWKESMVNFPHVTQGGDTPIDAVFRAATGVKKS